MKKRLIAICALLFTGSPFLYAEQVYYCVDEAVGGIAKGAGRWVGSSFEGERHTLKFNEDYTELKTGGDEYVCSKGTHGDLVMCRWSLRKGGELTDINAGVFYVFDKNKLRYVHVSAFFTGYLSDGRDTNSIQAGTCEKF